MWRRSLFSRLLWSHLLAVAVALLLSGTTTLLLVARNERTRLVERLDARAVVLASYAAEIAPSTLILEGLAGSIVRRFPPETGAAVRIFAPNGSLLSTTDELGAFPSQAVRPFISGPLPFLPLAPQTRVAVAQPVRRAGQIIGIVEVSAAGAEGARLQRMLLLVLVPAGLLAAGGGMLLALLLARNLLRPLAALRQVAGTIATGNLQTRADERRPDEIGHLAAEINRMAAELETRFAEVEHLAGTRREFYRSVSHELRTPLTAIRGIAENLEEDVPEADRAGLVIIQSETDRLNRLVDELLAGAEHPFVARRRRGPIPIEALVREVVDLMLPRAQRGGVRLTMDTTTSDVILGDRDRLKQALVNLLDNALKWTPPGGRVRVTLASISDAHEVRITVADSGPGIPAELRSAIWQRGIHGPDGGQGLGLALVHEVTTAHGGSARLMEGPGTTIELRLPVAPVESFSW